MFPEERRSAIIRILNELGRLHVTDLSHDLGVSEVTVRQDLDLLEKQGLLRRTHGGAILSPQMGFERTFQLEAATSQEEKKRIGQAAAAMVSDGETIILDVGTTTTEVARHLKDRKGLTIITNAVNIAMLLEDSPDLTVIVTGGTLRAKQHSLVNPYGCLVLEHINADLVFMGASGIAADKGITNSNIAEAEMKRAFLRLASRRIVVADSSKIGNVALAKVADLDEITQLITDKQAEPSQVEMLRGQGLMVELV